VEQVMQRFIKKNWFHILIWAAMFIYLGLAPSLYVKFVLKKGKPLPVDGTLPETSEQIKLSIDGLEPYMYEGQKIYLLSGWAFSVLDANISPDMYERLIVLVSHSKIYYFPVQTVGRPGVQKVYKDLNMDLTNSGFRAYISKDVIQPGKYRIGIVFKNPSTGLAYYNDKPARYIIRSTNGFSCEK
jgi:hypothetical protein